MGVMHGLIKRFLDASDETCRKVNFVQLRVGLVWLLLMTKIGNKGGVYFNITHTAEVPNDGYPRYSIKPKTLFAQNGGLTITSHVEGVAQWTDCGTLSYTSTISTSNLLTIE